MVVSLDDAGSILIWERAGGQTPQQIDVSYLLFQLEICI